MQIDIDKKIFRIQLVALIVGMLLLVAKFGAYLFTHSNTILTDALESIINVTAGAFALYSLYLSAKPRDTEHPYGHGKVEYLAAGVEGTLIILAGGGIIIKSVLSFIQPAEIHHLDYGLAIVAISGAVNFGLGYWLEQTGKKHNSLVLEADGTHLKSDAYTSVGIIVGLGLILITGKLWLDSLVAGIMGIVIMITGIRLVRKSVAGIMDEADEEHLARIVNWLETHRKPEWIDVHNLRIIAYGNKLHIDCHVTIPWYYTLSDTHKILEDIAGVINDNYGAQVEFFIHPDPCIPQSCKHCLLADCNVRKQAFEKKLVWDVNNVRSNRKHGL